MTSKRDTRSEASAVFARGELARPRVRQPNSPWTMVLGMGGAVVIGFMAFTTLSHARTTRVEGGTLRPAIAQAPPAWAAAAQRFAQADAAPPVTAPPQTPPTTPVPPQLPPANPDPAENHWRAPAVVVDLSETGGPVAAKAPQTSVVVNGSPAVAPEDQRLNEQEKFAARVSNSTVDTVRASQMRDLSRVIPQGFVIPAVLETAIDSDLPGSVRAVVSHDVRGFDGSQVLIPRGSKLIGQYRSAVAVGQKRAFVVWSRLITPQGVSVDIGSPATDPLGRGGLAGKVDTHFMERFGSSILLSVISAGVQAAANSGSNNTSLVIGSAAQANQVASIALQKQIDIPATIRVPQGAPVQVSVARDLDFSGVAPVR